MSPEEIKEKINENIYENQDGDITGEVLNEILNDIVDAVEDSAQSVTVGETTTGDPGTEASVTNSGTSRAPILNFTIPRGADGRDGRDAVNPFKGWYTSAASLPANPSVGDYAYVKGATASAPAAIYECTTAGTWSDSGRKVDSANDETFATGQQLNETSIDPTQLKNPSAGSLAKAIDAMQLDEKLDGITRSVTKATFETVSGFKVQADGTLTANTNAKYATIDLGGADMVRFMGVELSTGSSATTKNTGYCFGHYEDDSFIEDAAYAYLATAESSRQHEYLLNVPAGSTHLRTNVAYGVLQESNFYCNLLSGSSVADMVNGVAAATIPNGDYTTESVDIANLTAYNLAFGEDNKWMAGSHHTIDVTDVRYMRIRSAKRIRIMLGKTLYLPRTDYAVNQAMVLEVGPDFNGYVSIPRGMTVAYLNTDETPDTLAMLRSDDQDIVLFSGSRLYSNDGVITLDTTGRYYTRFLKVKAGRKYSFSTMFNGSQSVALFFVPILPNIGDSTQEVSVGNYNQIDEFNKYLKPTQDGYYFTQIYSSSSPSVTSDAKIVEDFVDDYDASSLEYRQQNKFAFSRRSYCINISSSASAMYANSNNSYKHILIPVDESNRFVKVIANSEKVTYFAFLTSTLTAGGAVPYVDGTRLRVLARSTQSIFEIPEGTKYLYFYLDSSSADSYFPKYIGITKAYGYMPDIVQRNDYEDTKAILEQLTSTTRAENEIDGFKPLCLLHYSDLHGMKVNQDRINDFREVFGKYLDDTIQTGDILANKFADELPYGDVSTPEAIADNPNRNILSVIGNHDTRGTSDDSWHQYQGKPVYDKIIAPYKGYWGDIVQPEGADENGYCFYYKDYPNSRIRLVIIDGFDSDQTYQDTQLAWFANTLSDARTNNLAVIIASHYRIKSDALLDTSFTCFNAAVSNPDTSVANDAFIPLVDSFIQDGGEFVCWITGHSHYDAISKRNDPLQINICVGNASRYYNTSYQLHITNSMIHSEPNNSKTWDLFNLIVVDTYYKTISLMRIGSNHDKYGRYIKSACIKYSNANIIWK